MSEAQSNLFVQTGPELGNVFEDDVFLRRYLQRKLPAHVWSSVQPDLHAMGAMSGGALYRLQLADRLNDPTLTQWDAWGNRIDHVEVSPLWKRAAEVAARAGLIAIPYERRSGRYSRIHQFASVYLFHPSSDVYTCPLAMTDGAVRTLLVSGNQSLIARAVPRLTHRDPARAWTSGQWMTESTGGSDVGASLTRAVQTNGEWRLYGKKWFTSAVTADMALTLARPEGGGRGGSGLAMFYVETRDESGRLNGIRVERLKDKLGTRKVPTAELMLEGARATLVGEARNGTRDIEPMLIVTRTWNSVTSASFMRRALMLARSYAERRQAFGAQLEQLPLHADTLAGAEAETRGAFLLAFELVELLGKIEANEIDEEERALHRLITPIAKLLTAKQAVDVVSECIEAFGGAGYVEDTGLPLILRDTHVLPIWEGTTNVLALDAVLRSEIARGLPALRSRIERCVAAARDPRLAECARKAVAAVGRVQQALGSYSDARLLQSNARRVAMTLGRAFELALLVEHGQWELDALQSHGGVAAARRFTASAVDLLVDGLDPDDAQQLLREQNNNDGASQASTSQPQ